MSKISYPTEVVIDGVTYKRGDTVPHPKPKLIIRPANTGAGKTSFIPTRKDKR